MDYLKKIGVIGCGLMGQGIVKNLLKNKYQVWVFDINEEAMLKLERKGATPTKTATQLAKEIDCLILSLPSPILIEQLLMNKEDGLLNILPAGTIILDMSTNDVEITQRLYKEADAKQISFFDCPLSGGPAGAEAGTLTIIVGGNESDYHNILPVLQAVGENIQYVGPCGAGQTIKLCHNLVVAGVITLLSEALLTGEKAGIQKKTMAEIFQKGSAQTKVMDVFGSNIINNSFEKINFSLENMMKDIHLYRNLAENIQVPTVVSNNIHQIFKITSNKEKDSIDSTAVYKLLKTLGR